ncbi:MAG TPA: error-prone DNA polymerase [Thermoanaerobaculia bacterium]|nr:error-prone DNA polymerase [Thermoanaerobaculia bacterium]
MAKKKDAPTSPPPREVGKWLDLNGLQEAVGPPRDFGYDLPALESSPGAKKEKVRHREYLRTARRSGPPSPYVELHTASAFSFLNGASLPEDMIVRAAELGLPAVALADANGVYGAPRFHQAARQAGVRALVGAEVVLEEAPGLAERIQRSGKAGPLGLVPAPAPEVRKEKRILGIPSGSRLTLLVENRTGYKNLCRMLTTAALGRPKGEARVTWDLLAEHARGLHCLTGGDEGPVARELAQGGMDPARGLLERLAVLFGGRVHVELQRHRLREEEHRNRALIDLARRLRLPLVATNGARYARPEDKPLHDVLTAIRHHTTLDAAGRLLACHRERHLKSPEEMARLFADLPEAIEETARLASRLDFTLADLGYRFPDYPLPSGETPASYLRHITWNGAKARFRPLTAKAQVQIQKELDLIEKLDLAGYFLIVWDIVNFCLRENILVQGRGSAANSAVCYALSITAIDPVKMELLFERFLSEERGEWPDIDLDLPSGDQREKVIQHVYKTYGERGAAMTANVITYRDRSATREVAKVFGYSAEQVDRLAKQLGSWTYDLANGDPKSFENELAAAGFDPEEPRMKHFSDLWVRIHNLPRHLGQHSGGMVISAGRLDEVVPLEPAAMPGRVVVQWDKDDCADLGIIKVDLLGLGMLSALEEMVPVIRDHEGVHLDLAHLPADDPKVYRMLQQADTIGVFQVESRAQMASLPRNHPTRFYDLVIQVGIIRPGPIAGKMASPYFERRNGRQTVTYPHPSLEPILKRTLGVPLFQEQLLRVAMVAAGFSGGEAEELRRAMGSKRSVEKMKAIVDKLRQGMTANGITGKAQDEIVLAITSFALYGFPESHAASFALIAYASSWLKCHHPTAFTYGLLNAWPMGFYHPATLVKDAQRHGVEIHPVDVQRSGYKCRWEDREIHEAAPAGAIRLGFKFVRGLRHKTGLALEQEQAKGPFADAEDLVRRCDLREDELQILASIGALSSFGLTRRAALWQVARLAKEAGPLLDRLPDPEPSPLAEMSEVEESRADYAGTQLTLGPHPLTYIRETLNEKGVVSAENLLNLENGDRVRTAGSVIVRQRPGTAKGLLFLTLEDETGMSQAIVSVELLQKHRRLIVGSPGLVVEGVLQKRDGTMSVKGERFWSLKNLVAVPSHDFH